MFTALGGMIPNPIGTISEFRRNCHSTGQSATGRRWLKPKLFVGCNATQREFVSFRPLDSSHSVAELAGAGTDGHSSLLG
jgi:hypothetical protein